MSIIVIIIHVIVSIALIMIVLLQTGKGADMGAAFGGGSQTLFGARGSASFLSRVTGGLAAVFFVTSLTLAYIYSQTSQPQSVTEQIQVQPAPAEQGDIPQIPADSQDGDQSDIPAVPEPAPE